MAAAKNDLNESLFTANSFKALAEKVASWLEEKHEEEYTVQTDETYYPRHINVYNEERFGVSLTASNLNKPQTTIKCEGRLFYSSEADIPAVKFLSSQPIDAMLRVIEEQLMPVYLSLWEKEKQAQQRERFKQRLKQYGLNYIARRAGGVSMAHNPWAVGGSDGVKWEAYIYPHHYVSGYTLKLHGLSPKEIMAAINLIRSMRGECEAEEETDG